MWGGVDGRSRSRSSLFPSFPPSLARSWTPATSSKRGGGGGLEGGERDLFLLSVLCMREKKKEEGGRGEMYLVGGRAVRTREKCRAKTRRGFLAYKPG